MSLALEFRPFNWREGVAMALVRAQSADPAVGTGGESDFLISVSRVSSAVRTG